MKLVLAFQFCFFLIFGAVTGQMYNILSAKHYMQGYTQAVVHVPLKTLSEVEL